MDIEEYSKYKQFYTEEIPELLLRYLTKFSWKTYLDLGCGDGSLLYALNKKGYLNNKVVYAVDLSESRIGLVKKINRNFICLVGDACNIKDIQDNSVDFLVSEMLVEHIGNDDDLIKEIGRVLKRDGIVYLSTIFKKWYGWYFYRCNGRWTADPTHLREYSKDSQLIDIFTKYGFEVVESKKTLAKRSLVDFVLKRTGCDRTIFISHPFLQFIRNFSIPIFGYYNWEIICKK